MNRNVRRLALAVASLAIAASGALQARDRGFNQPGALGNPRMDPGLNQPGAAGNVGVGGPGGGAPGAGVRDPGLNQPGAIGNTGTARRSVRRY
jgi:hypothetical protein